MHRKAKSVVETTSSSCHTACTAGGAEPVHLDAGGSASRKFDELLPTDGTIPAGELRGALLVARLTAARRGKVPADRCDPPEATPPRGRPAPWWCGIAWGWGEKSGVQKGGPGPTHAPQPLGSLEPKGPWYVCVLDYVRMLNPNPTRPCTTWAYIITYPPVAAVATLWEIEPVVHHRHLPSSPCGCGDRKRRGLIITRE